MGLSDQFLFVSCQAGAEPLLKHELSVQWPDFRLAFSRPGFVTFKAPGPLPDVIDLRSTFARAHGHCLGKSVGRLGESLAADVWSLWGDRHAEHLHVWQRDARLPGDRGFEPFPTPLAMEVAARINDARPGRISDPLPVNRQAGPGQSILDCVVVEPNQWWVGCHQASSVAGCWPGGCPPLSVPGDMVNRAYLKTSEALAWSKLPVRPGEVCVEIGSAPGGAAQALLERGLHVMGIDPAEIDERVAGHPNFAHVRKRAADLPRRAFSEARWLFADTNTAPLYTLDCVESIVTHPKVRVRGLVLTLKLLEPQLAHELASYAERVRGWGYHYVRTRQLCFNRREICLVALRSRAARRPPRRTADRPAVPPSSAP